MSCGRARRRLLPANFCLTFPLSACSDRLIFQIPGIVFYPYATLEMFSLPLRREPTRPSTPPLSSAHGGRRPPSCRPCPAGEEIKSSSTRSSIRFLLSCFLSFDVNLFFLSPYLVNPCSPTRFVTSGRRDSAVCCVVPDVMWFSAQSAARELGLPMLGLMTSRAVSFRTININYVGFIC
jgi:hypothetical protein